MRNRIRKALPLAILALAASLLPANATAASLRGHHRSFGDLCITNYGGTSTISLTSCNANDRGQRWIYYGSSGLIVLKRTANDNPGYCLANVLGTSEITTKPCNVDDGGQAWDQFTPFSSDGFLLGFQFRLRFTGPSSTPGQGPYCLSDATGSTLASLECGDSASNQRWDFDDDRITLAN